MSLVVDFTFDQTKKKYFFLNFLFDVMMNYGFEKAEKRLRNAFVSEKKFSVPLVRSLEVLFKGKLVCCHSLIPHVLENKNVKRCKIEI